MLKLLTIYFGTFLLLYLSQIYYPTDALDFPHSTPTYRTRRTDFFIGVAIFWLTCFYFLRTGYNDTGTYIRNFLAAVSPEEFIASGQLRDLTGNPLFYYYESLMRSITSNPHLFLLPPSFLLNYAVIKLFKRYSVSPSVSILIYFSVGSFAMFMAAIKQGIAVSILLLSIPYVLDRKYVRFYLMVALAALFHTYAIFFVILPLLCSTPWSKRTWLLLIFAVFSLMTYRQTLGVFFEYLDSFGAHVSEEELFDKNAINILRVAVYLVPAVLALLFHPHLFYESSREENLFVNLSILSGFILMIGLAEGANLMARMAAFFEIGTAVCLPWMIKKIFTRDSARLVTFSAVILYFGYFLYEFTVSKDFAGSYSSISLWQFFTGLLP